jgi:ribose transport system permease protein
MARSSQDVIKDEATTPAGSSRPGAALSGRTRLALGAMQGLGLGGFYVIVLIYFSIYAAPYFFTETNAVNILSTVSVIGVVTIGQALVLIAGGFDLSVAGTVPLGGVIFTILLNRGVDIPEAWFVAVLAGCAIGVANGLIITRIGINALVTTLGTLSITSGLAYVVTNGETVAFNNLNQDPIDTVVAGMPLYVWTMILISIIAFVLLRFSVFGRMIYAIGGNREASRLAGIRVDLVTTIVYATSGGLGTFAGVMLAQQLIAGAPTVGSTAALTSIAAVILGGASLSGGVGGIPGTLVGVLVLGTIANGMALMQVPSFYQQIATGGILLLAVGFGRLRVIFGQLAG